MGEAAVPDGCLLLVGTEELLDILWTDEGVEGWEGGLWGVEYGVGGGGG